jgi:PAS domain S-box-containing protein
MVLTRTRWIGVGFAVALLLLGVVGWLSSFGAGRARLLVPSANLGAFLLVGLASLLVVGELRARRRAETALRDHAAEFADLYDHAPCGYHSLDADGRYVRVNQTELTWLGYTPDEMLGKPFTAFLTPESRSVFEESYPAFREGGVHKLEVHLRRKDGSTLPVLLSTTAVHDAAGRFRKTRATVFDIADRKKLERALRQAHDQLDDRVRDRTAELARSNTLLKAEVVERQRTAKQLEEHARRLRDLSRQLLEAQEAERRRIARELHDEIGQVLTAVKINLQALQRSTEPAKPLPRLQESLTIVERALQQVRNLSLDLRPSLLDDLGLAAALRWYLDRQGQRAEFQAHFHAEPADLPLSPELATACFRVTQEAVTNVVRHAKARNVWVDVRREDGELVLTVRDDGAGFDVPRAEERAVRGGSLGLVSMRERAGLLGGRLEIDSAPGRGSLIRARFPLPEGTEGGEREQRSIA